MNTKINTPLLDKIDSPTDLRKLPESQLDQVVDEIREFLLYSVSKSGGHFAASLGATELTIALHYLYNTPDDRLVWDVGHQAYIHKILTGRKERLNTIRQWKGLLHSRNETKVNMMLSVLVILVHQLVLL